MIPTAACQYSRFLSPAGIRYQPAHKNNAYEEVLYGIEGVLTWTVDRTV